jgi:hypothetical protein
LIVSGRNNHDWPVTTPFLRKVLLQTGRIVPYVTEEPVGIHAGTLAKYDVLVLNYCGPRWPKETEDAVESFVRSGKGLVAVHAASYSFGGLPVLADRQIVLGRNALPPEPDEPAWPAYFQMLGARWALDAPRTGHATRHAYQVKWVDRDHAIARGMAESFPMGDELYHSFRLRPNIHLLAQAFDDPAVGGTGKEEPVLWTVEYGKGRVFHTSLGHDLAAMEEPGFVTTFARGTEWAATGAVTIPADFQVDAPAAKPVRVLVVTGGHPFDASFDSVFEGYNDIQAAVNPHPSAFRANLKKQYDVIALYDMVQVQDVEETQRKNLQDFVESGKGLVVLHHALLDYNGWPWWYREVVGGRYLVKPDGDMPASTFKHDEDQVITPVVAHPVTRGIGIVHIQDETFKGVWISPSVKVLLRTNNPTSDGPVAWISPYEKSKVVVIQLGHDHHAHQHPAYRALVRNAILWSAGRLQ